MRKMSRNAAQGPYPSWKGDPRRITLALIAVFLMAAVPLCIVSDGQSSGEGDGGAGATIYFDLSMGDVFINDATYSGYVSATLGGSATDTTGTHNDSNTYYVYQSNGDIVDYERVVGSGDNLVNIVDARGVASVVAAWEAKAISVGRTPTAHRISIDSNATSTFNVTIDDVWSSFLEEDPGRKNGGLSFYPLGDSSATAVITLVDDNRFSNIFYSSAYKNNTMTFTAEDEESGTLTVAGTVDNQNGNLWNSVIGASDNCQTAFGLRFSNGTIWAGAYEWDKCTTIGAGGNGNTTVLVNGATLTAINESYSAAIGGGIGLGLEGGIGTVTIESGKVYARSVNGVAIGGGSTVSSEGGSAIVEISGGEVYASSENSASIGGGNGATFGGNLEFTQTGGTVAPCSMSGGSGATPGTSSIDISTIGSTVTLDPNYSGEPRVTHYYGVAGTYDLPLNTFARTGYAFNGWNTVPAGGGTGYGDGATISLSSSGTTLYAQWTLVAPVIVPLES